MTIQEIAARLEKLCAEGDFLTAQNELYDESAVSIEPIETPLYKKETKGLKSLNEKITTFNASVEEMYAIHVSHPLIAGNVIAMAFVFDIQMKGSERQTMEEIAVYEVKNEKIISERFFM